MRWVMLPALAALHLGCSATRPPRYFVATATLVTQVPAPPADDIRESVPSAGILLKKPNALVGFAPPAICRDLSRLPEALATATENQCQALMTGLEKVATLRGYRVVDWNQLRLDPYGAAKALNADVLFVIDTLEVQLKGASSFDVTAVSFTEQESATRREPHPLDNARAVGARCKTVFAAEAKAAPPSTIEVTGLTVAMKMVSVEDGVSQWFYRHTESQASGAQSASVENDLYYLSRGTKERGVGKIVVGTVLSGVGIAAAVVGSRLLQDGTSLTLRNVGVGLTWFSAIPFAIALPIGAVGIYKEARPAKYEPPEEVICRGEPLTENPFLTPGGAPKGAEGPLSTVETSPRARNDAPLVTTDGTRLVEGLISHFFSELNTLIMNAAPSPPIPTAPPAEAAPDGPVVTITTTDDPAMTTEADSAESSNIVIVEKSGPAGTASSEEAP